MHGGDIYSHKTELDFSISVNPLPIPESVKEALKLGIDDCSVYPDLKNRKLKEAMAGAYKTDEGSFIIGNGASELFMAIMHGLKPKKVLIPCPCYTGYEHAVNASGGGIVRYVLPACNGYCITEDILSYIDEKPDVLILTNPNNPVGNLINAELLEKIIEKCRVNNVFVVLDECFIEFTGKEELSYLSKINNYHNVIIVRAFTKFYSMPGVRLAYAVTANNRLKELTEAQLPEWNISSFAARAGEAALSEKYYFNKVLQIIDKERAFLSEKLKEMGMAVFPSDANFIMFRTDREIAGELMKRGILIRRLGDVYGLTNEYYRIGIRTHDDNLRLSEALEDICL